MWMMHVLAYPLIVAVAAAALLWRWHGQVGFDALDGRWWRWLLATIPSRGGPPAPMASALLGTALAMLAALAVNAALARRARHATVSGGRGSGDLHGSARWAAARDVRKAGLLDGRGVVVGGLRDGFGRVRALREDGPEHVLAFAPTRSGKGVSLILPTLLTWRESLFVNDIKGENFARSAGWLHAAGHRVIRLEPAAPEGSARFNPLAEVRLDTDRDIADCQNIATMVIDQDGRGLHDYWRQEGWGWLSVVLLHVLYRTRAEEGRVASFDDVNEFLSGIEPGDEDQEVDHQFIKILKDMGAHRHGLDHVDREVRRGANAMAIKAPQERSGVHSTAKTQLTVFADPIVARNTAESDFRLDDLMNGDLPMALFFIVGPGDMDRLRPLIRIILNLVLRRQTECLEFVAGEARPRYRHRLLLMLDELAAIGKMEILEQSLAFIAGYGVKAYLVVQDTRQLERIYGRDCVLMSNCRTRVAFAPNLPETAALLSRMTGEATVVQRRRSRSGPGRLGGSVSDSLSETRRPLLTADECMRLEVLDVRGGKARPGECLVFVAGLPPIRGRQALYFLDPDLERHSRVPPPRMPGRATGKPTPRPDDGRRS